MTISVIRKPTQEEVTYWMADFIPRLELWFKENPHRKICKCTWIDGRSIDLRPDSYMARVNKELAAMGYKKEGGAE
jgi:hypothetical protein